VSGRSLKVSFSTQKFTKVPIYFFLNPYATGSRSQKWPRAMAALNDIGSKSGGAIVWLGFFPKQEKFPLVSFYVLLWRHGEHRQQQVTQ